MLTQQRIQELIRLPKTIVRRRPSSGYREESGSRRCDLDLRSHGQDDGTFAVFIRQNLQFAENFSIGLRYRADLPLGAITLIALQRAARGEQPGSGRALRQVAHPPHHPTGNYIREHTTAGTRSHDH